MNVNAIELRGVTLVRRTQEELHYDFKRWLFDFVRNRTKPVMRRRVLHDVDFAVERGKKVGIIGPNGSGKSTLLKVICGILTPTRGSVNVIGRVSPLIELGAGFDPYLSVSDNVIYYGILLGHSRATMLARLTNILEFAGLSDRQHEPVMALSSGMAARLGFAVATELRPDILILDEVLSVGDQAFREKCRARIESLWDTSMTVLVVSHDLSYIADNCDLAVRLDDGHLVDAGAPDRVVKSYLDELRDYHRGDRPLTNYNVFTNFSRANVGQIRSCIASFDTIERDGDRLDLLGWASFETEAGLANEAYLLVGDRHLTRIPYGQARPDVAVALGNARYLKSGFAACLDLPGLPPGEYSLRIVMRRGGEYAMSNAFGPLVAEARAHGFASLA